MFMDPADVKKFPKSVQFLRGVNATLTRKPKIRDAFFKACKADAQRRPTKVAEQLARNALAFGGPPRVDVVPGLLRVPVEGSVVDACGFTNEFGAVFHSGATPFVQITSFFFDAVEDGFDPDPDRAGNRLMRTVLHELVHWVRGAANASDGILVGSDLKEAGHVFENWAYGTSNICTDDEVWAAILSRRK
jgi:hypothetical protein